MDCHGCHRITKPLRNKKNKPEEWEPHLRVNILVITAEDKATILRPNELPNLVGPFRLDDRNYLQLAQYIRTTFKGRKKLSHIEGSGPPRHDTKFEAWDDEDFLIMTWL
ncbi:hypothetical protein CR513_39812, partial [Mucuna pruriens]